jgi:hypothetical protein
MGTALGVFGSRCFSLTLHRPKDHGSLAAPEIQLLRHVRQMLSQQPNRIG